MPTTYGAGVGLLETERDGLYGRDLTVRTVQFRFRPKSLDEKTHSVEAVLATDQPCTVLDLKRWQVIDEILCMDGALLPEQIPLLRDHQRQNTDAVLGSWRQLRTETRDGVEVLVGRMFFVLDDADADRHWNKVHQGHLTDVSAGYRVDEYDEVEPGQTKTVKGKEYTAGARRLRVTTLWKPREGSLTPVGADESAKVRHSSSAGDPGSEPRPSLVASRTQVAGEPGADVRVAEEATQAERARVRAVADLAGEDVSADLVQRAVDEGWDEARASREFLANIRERRPASVRVLDTQQEGMRAAVATALVLRAGLEVKDEKARERSRQFRGLGFQDIARLALHAESKRVPLDPAELFERALSTISLPEILGTSLARILEQSYQETPSTLMVWTDERDVNDFRTVNALRLSEFCSLVKVGAGGQLEYASLEESKETYGVDTYGRIIAVTRRDFINDDLGAFLRLPGDMGRAARRNVEDLGYELLVSALGLGPTLGEDGQALFSASHGGGSNYYVDAAAALDNVSLGKVKAMLRVIKHGEARPNTTAKYLIVPAALEQTALELVKSSNIMIAVAGETSSTVVIPTANVHQGTVQPVVENRLDDATNGATAWYAAADQKQVPTLVRVYLRGQRNPVVEKVDLPANILGLGWRAYHDYGVGVVDYRGIVRSKGAA